MITFYILIFSVLEAEDFDSCKGKRPGEPDFQLHCMTLSTYTWSCRQERGGLLKLI